MPSLAPRTTFLFFSGVMLTCMCGLMLQIMETRVLSIIGYYYLAFFAIGIAMLGMTAGALAVFYFVDPKSSAAAVRRLMANIMTGFAWSVLISLVLLVNVSLGALFKPTITFISAWLVASLVLLPPYVLLGAAVSLALTRSPFPINLVYGVDLVGAAAGCLVTLALLTITDTYTAILLVGVVGALAALCFLEEPEAAAGRSTKRAGIRLSTHPLLPLFVVACLAFVNHEARMYGLRPLMIKNTIENVSTLRDERWNSFSRISLQMRPSSQAFMWSASKIAPKPNIDQGWLAIDGSAGTPIYRYDGDPRKMDFLRYDATAFAYNIRNRGRSAVIGIGGGRDLLTASISGFRDITGVEYNPIFVRLFSHDYAWLSGYEHVDGLKLSIDDARSWFARSHDQFDLIQMSLIDTWAATGAGAFTLSENGLYTVNGWKRFLARLSPTGVFTVSRWFAPDRADETARILSLAMATLIEMRATDPAAHIYLIGNGNLSTLIVGRAPLTAQDVAMLDAAAARLGFRVLAAPGHAAADPLFARILQARSTKELIAFGHTTDINLAPTWDANPFFFNQLRLSDPASVMRAYRADHGAVHGNLDASLALITLVAISALVVVFVLLAPARKATLHVGHRGLVWSSAYFVTIGVGFMFVELSLVQRMSLFLGHPIYGLAIVLFSVIFSTGAGSFFSDRTMRPKAVAMALWPLALAAYLATLPLWMGMVLDATETGPLLQRAAVCVGMIAPGGFLMGFMFPAGMRLCSRIGMGMTPWLWAVNGAAGVLASGAAILVAIQTSLNVTLWLGAALYAFLAIAAVRLLMLGADADGAMRPVHDGVPARDEGVEGRRGVRQAAAVNAYR